MNFRIANQKPAQHGHALSFLVAIQEFETKSVSIGAGTIAAAATVRHCESQNLFYLLEVLFSGTIRISAYLRGDALSVAAENGENSQIPLAIDTRRRP